MLKGDTEGLRNQITWIWSPPVFENFHFHTDINIRGQSWSKRGIWKLNMGLRMFNGSTSKLRNGAGQLKEALVSFFFYKKNLLIENFFEKW